MSDPTTGGRFVMRDHAIFDTKADAFIGAGDACYLLNEINAALAALDYECQHQRLVAQSWFDKHQAIEQQLAAANDMWDKASRQADTLAEYLVDAKADLAVAQEQLAAAVEALKQYMVAMEAIHNHNEASRSAVVQHFGTLHPRKAVELIGKSDVALAKIGKL